MPLIRTTFGWLSAMILTFAIPGTVLAEPVTLERDSVVYTEPRAGAGVAGNLSKGTAAEAVARQGGWLQVKAGEVRGWLYSFNVRFGAVSAGSGEGSGAGSALGRIFAPRQRVNVTATIGIRGLEEEDLKQARFDEAQIKQLDGFAATREQAEARAASAGLDAVQVEYLGQAPAAGGSQ